MKPYKTLLYYLFGALVAAGLYCVFIPELTSLKDPGIFPETGTISGSAGVISIRFPVPMNRETVESRLGIAPTRDFDIVWHESTLQIKPGRAFPSGSQLEVYLRSGSTSQDGREYKKDFRWSYTIRPPSILYLGNATTAPEVWKYDFSTGQNTALTRTGGLVTGLAVSQTGDVILYSQKNASGGSDIYAVFLREQSPKLLVLCGKETCVDPAISADGRLFAFSRNREPEEGNTSQLFYIYTGLIDKGEEGITPLITEKSIPGILPAFSPDGEKISFYDSKSQGIRIVNKSGSNDFLLGTNRTQHGCWSPDGERFMFVDDEMGQHSIFSRLYVVKITNSTISEPLKDVLTGLELGEPDWSPDGKRIVVGTRAEGGPLTRQLTIYDLKTNEMTQITGDPTVINASPDWSPDGGYIVFQQARLGISNAKPVIALWDAVKKDVTTIAEDAALPLWMP